MAADANRQVGRVVKADQGTPPLLPIGDQLEAKMSRDVRRLEQKEMFIARKVLVTSAVVAGNRLREVTILGDDFGHVVARHLALRPANAAPSL